MTIRFRFVAFVGQQMAAVGTVLPCVQIGVSRKDVRRYAVEEVNQMRGSEVLR
jgi:hypothetical protein